MAISDAVQTLSAAFSFGILLQAATGALFIYFRGHGSTILKDGRRLALVLFLLFAVLWAQMGFVNLLIIAGHSTTCQATVIFWTALDQLGRFGVEQFLLWSIKQGTKANIGQLLLQLILFIRLIAGGSLVGFTRPDFAPVCISRTSVKPLAIVVFVLDFVIIGFLIIRSVSLGIFREIKDSRSSTQDQSKGLILAIVGFTIWTATSVPLILGVPTIILIVRTVVPANGLLILIGKINFLAFLAVTKNLANNIVLLTISSGSLLETREEITTPEAHSPFVAPPQSTREIFREEINNGSPIVGPNYTRGGSLFVVNPSSTPRDSPTAPQSSFQPSPAGLSKLGETNIAGRRGSSGIFPTIFASSMSYDNGALAPHIRPDIIQSTRNVPTLSVPTPTSQQKTSLFNRSRQPARPNVRALGISKPIVIGDEASSQQPFARIQTIDLAQAAANERERRAAATDRSRLVASRPAPPPPPQFSFPAQEGLRKSISVKRKDIPGRLQEAMSTIASSASSGLSVEAVNGSTTSASLSPGREEVRRRSPRNTNYFDTLIDEKVRPLATLQTKQTMGLPSNPRATRIAPGRPMATAQTVMFMSDIVYDNPGIVKTIIKGAPELYAASKRAKDSETASATLYAVPLKSSDSIIHRPRPYRRNSEKDRAFFPSEPSPRHRRSKSGSSISTRKSILMSVPGSPTQLPPLPPPPTSASKLQRLLPYDMKSTSAEEKIQLLFPAPPGPTIKQNRRSSVPRLPRVPSVYMLETPQRRSPTQEEQASRRASKRTTIASIELPGALSTSQLQTTGNERQTYRFSANTYLALADELDETWIPGTPDKTDLNSHILQRTRDSHITNTSIGGDSTTNWGSMHSEIPLVDQRKVVSSANSTFVQRPRTNTLEETMSLSSSEQVEGIHRKEIMTVMLDCEDGRPSIVTSSESRQDVFFSDANEESPGHEQSSAMAGTTWHRRIGDKLPTFSERKTRTRSRKMPPPTPLLLNQRGRIVTVVVRAEPSPPVMDSPQRAIAEIQAQLKRFEEPGRGSVGSILRHLPDAASRDDKTLNETQNDRLRLLESLENEMGQQQNQWQRMQTNLDRDSVSTIATPYVPAESESDISRESSQRSSRPPSRAVPRRARVGESVNTQSKADDSTSTTSTQSSYISRASLWQQRLAEAQLEYMENAPALLRKQSVNFLSISRSHQLGSPTPPESVDSGTDIESDFEVGPESRQDWIIAPKEIASLWATPLPLPKATADRMWCPPVQMIQHAPSPEPPAKYIRPAQRQTQAALHISSSDLWIKPASAPNSRPVVGLWGSRLVRPVSIRTRPVTQRPARKSKRITFLPDIVESPVPLPNKRETLGIFQFPWGETSESAVYQPALSPALLAGSILNAELCARSRQLEPEPEYSSSFFDDYDEDVDEYEESESDDDFDETTLWEIASLLKSGDVPSKNSLLPRARDIVDEYEVEEEANFEKDMIVEEIYETEEVTQGLMITELPLIPAAMRIKETVEVELKVKYELWSSPTTALEVVNMGLPQPELNVWQTYLSTSENMALCQRRPPENLPSLNSSILWAISEPGAADVSTWPMWSAKNTHVARIDTAPKEPSPLMWTPQPKQVEEVSKAGLFSLDTKRSNFRVTKASPAASSLIRTPRPSNDSLTVLSSRTLWAHEQLTKKPTLWISAATITKLMTPAQALWTPVAEAAPVTVCGLFSFSQNRSDYRSTTLESVAQNMIRKPWTPNAHLTQLTSHQPWQLPSSLTYEHHWITESSIRPASPSIFSESSSNPTSPASETSSISGASLMSTSTKASSLWESIKSGSAPTWLENRDSKKSPSSPPPSQNAKVASKPPALASVRESRVLATRDMWETKTRLPLDKMPKSNLRTVKVAKEAEFVEVMSSFEAPAKAKLHNLHLQRPKATPAMWKAALEEAITMGSMPALVKAPQYDSAVTHPVFFTSSLVSYIIDIHPAAIGHVLRPQAQSLWSPSCSHIVVIDAPIGALWVKGKVAVAQFEHDKTETKRSSPISRSAELPILDSANLWQSSQSATARERNWIFPMKLPNPQTWTVPKTTATEENKGMWTPRVSLKVTPLDVFAHVVNPLTKKPSPRREALSILASSELFTPSRSNTKATHWLHATKTSKGSNTLSATLTWTAPRSKGFPKLESNSLWSALAVEQTEEERSIFENVEAEPWSRKKHSDPGVEISELQLESQEMWKPKLEIPQSPKRWLEDGWNRVTKV